MYADVMMVAGPQTLTYWVNAGSQMSPRPAAWPSKPLPYVTGPGRALSPGWEQAVHAQSQYIAWCHRPSGSLFRRPAS